MSQLKDLGVAVKAYRVALNESIKDLAQAVELEASLIAKLEAGLHKPDKETLEILSRHFNLQEKEAKRLQKLSGYNESDFSMNLEKVDFNIEEVKNETEVMIAPVFYTDMVNVVSNQYGVTVNFIQHAGSDNKPVVVSRLGMSHKHAESIITVLKETLDRVNKAKPSETSEE